MNYVKRAEEEIQKRIDESRVKEAIRLTLEINKMEERVTQYKDLLKNIGTWTPSFNEGERW